ncbi:MAG TPA: glutamate-5-semialdehyde dehydrogenase [Tepidisphaeraceae bacterium]|nr:glutamate-5-semialdehyde dehydrogenase [Tepidisphaeraceae bacterium]
MDALLTYAHEFADAGRAAATALATASGAVRSQALRALARSLRDHADRLIAANASDIAAAEQAHLDRPLIERLKLDPKRIDKMALACEQIAEQPDPIGQILEGYVRPNGLRIQKQRAPLGVVLFIYESRPNVTTDAAALAIRSANAVILRGGKETLHTNAILAEIISQSLEQSKLPAKAVQIVATPDRALLPHLLKLAGKIDLVIPRGGAGLIRAVSEQSVIPVLKHFDGNCHLYIDSSTEQMERAVRDVCVNAKTSYPGGAVCNAVEHILFHKDAAPRLLAKVCDDLANKGVEIRACERSRVFYPKAGHIGDDDWSTEYLAFVVGVKVVDSIDDAIAHINRYGSHHTDGILADSASAIEQFVQRVDSASVMINASTRFADGGEYGLGAELGISTDKLHARGPMGAADMTSTKWIVIGRGHCR